MKRRGLAFLLCIAGWACVLAMIGGCSANLDDDFSDSEWWRRLEGKLAEGRRLRVEQRMERDCAAVPAPGVRAPADLDVLFRELRATLVWLTANGEADFSVDPSSWCRWHAEIVEGLRASVPAWTPPPVESLPSPELLRGIARTEILQRLGPPRRGCLVLAGGRFIDVPCVSASEITYPFFVLNPGPGGGDELELRFDDAGICVQARWIGTQ